MYESVLRQRYVEVERLIQERNALNRKIAAYQKDTKKQKNGMAYLFEEDNTIEVRMLKKYNTIEGHERYFALIGGHNREDIVKDIVSLIDDLTNIKKALEQVDSLTVR